VEAYTIPRKDADLKVEQEDRLKAGKPETEGKKWWKPIRRVTDEEYARILESQIRIAEAKKRANEDIAKNLVRETERRTRDDEDR